MNGSRTDHSSSDTSLRSGQDASGSNKGPESGVACMCAPRAQAHGFCHCAFTPRSFRRPPSERDQRHSSPSNCKAIARPRRSPGPLSVHFTLMPMVCPPSTTIACPVVKAPRVELSHNTADAISSGFPKRPIGSCAIMLAYPSGAPAATR